MNQQIHPELHRLQQQYLQLVQAVQDQTMTVDQAMGTLQALRVIDGSGAEWSYTPEGQLMRAIPGQPGQPAEPWEFTQPQLPPHASDPGLGMQQSGWGGGAAFPQQGMPQQGMPQQGGPFPQQGMPQQSGPFPQQDGWGGGPTVVGRSLPTSDPRQGQARPAGVQAIIDRLRANAKLIIVAVGCLIVLAVGLSLVGRGSDSETVADVVPVTPPAPVETPVPSPEPIPVPLPEPAPQPGEEGGEEQEAEIDVPDGDRVGEVLNTLRSGREDLVEGVVANPGSELSSRLLAAQLSGLQAVGLDLVASPPSPAGPGQATQVWQIVDAGSGETLGTVTVIWQRTGDVWKLSAVPPLG